MGNESSRNRNREIKPSPYHYDPTQAKYETSTELTSYGVNSHKSPVDSYSKGTKYGNAAAELARSANDYDSSVYGIANRTEQRMDGSSRELKSKRKQQLRRGDVVGAAKSYMGERELQKAQRTNFEHYEYDLNANKRDFGVRYSDNMTKGKGSVDKLPRTYSDPYYEAQTSEWGGRHDRWAIKTDKDVNNAWSEKERLERVKLKRAQKERERQEDLELERVYDEIDEEYR